MTTQNLKTYPSLYDWFYANITIEMGRQLEAHGAQSGVGGLTDPRLALALFEAHKAEIEERLTDNGDIELWEVIDDFKVKNFTELCIRLVWQVVEDIASLELRACEESERVGCVYFDDHPEEVFESDDQFDAAQSNGGAV
jgi:hypothetical protein